MKLTEDYKKFTKAFKELQKKYERFEESDDKRMKQVYDMNSAEALALSEKIMHADKVIHI